jgi:hypothetical protein
MKTAFLLIILLALPLAAQTTTLGGIATPPDVTTALNGFLITRTTVPASMAFSVASGDSTIQLPSAISSLCVENYSITVLSSTSNVTTATVSTANVPTGTRITISNATTSAYNATFATTSAPSNSSSLAWALTIADGTYSNSSPQTNGYPVLTYNHCAVLIDSEAIEITGTTDGTSYTASRGVMGTSAASHASGATVTLLQYANLRAAYRAQAQSWVNQTILSVGTTRINAAKATLANAQAALNALLAQFGQ